MTLTLTEFFEELPNRLIPDASSDLHCTIQWQLTDEQAGTWAIQIDEGQGRVIPGGVDEPDTTFITTSDVWMAIAEGRQDPMRAFMSGKLLVEGDMTLALRVPEVFDTRPA
ncbi:SCP2 sterol-binding domain-containing protein [Kribbella sp. CA-294648]|uniref:SCP2 sterol-binding domain-containing protein n=1 Tax=Kribbella sp. CA-294648 TaxID=3239948 RepID=UPI003D8E8F7F